MITKIQISVIDLIIVRSYLLQTVFHAQSEPNILTINYHLQFYNLNMKTTGIP
ncbi:Hypothetical protein EAG7_01428 [Klebsiella aerogenes]|nr:Hypothetical protein EAG7_01428 [Klebsiella aerogenes]CCG29886.1 hypothetical protein [Klebsiella aerogenes EA1509E]